MDHLRRIADRLGKPRETSAPPPSRDNLGVPITGDLLMDYPTVALLFLLVIGFVGMLGVLSVVAVLHASMRI
jgi:hypothetical protein